MIMIFIQYVHRYCSSIELGPIFPWEVTKKYGFHAKQIVERYLKVRLGFLADFFSLLYYTIQGGGLGWPEKQTNSRQHYSNQMQSDKLQVSTLCEIT